ncbi:hypothetical protein NEOC65_000059 [Neochlamydia sp. AcF65]|nr:hypothetical protein [Neochlamydia sp. AcF65]
MLIFILTFTSLNFFINSDHLAKVNEEFTLALPIS